MDGGKHVRVVDGFFDIPVDLEFDRLHQVGDIVKGGGDQDRDVGIDGLDLLGHLQPVQPWHLDISNDQFRTVFFKKRQPLFTIDCHIDPGKTAV